MKKITLIIKIIQAFNKTRLVLRKTSNTLKGNVKK